MPLPRDAAPPPIPSTPFPPAAFPPAPVAPVIAAPPDDPLRRDAACITAIARRHAAIALAGPAETQSARLAACRLVWINYATAFAVSAATQKRFADDMVEITRALMAHQQAGDLALPAAGAAILTIEELRPLLRQIIEQ